ncbi:hypothetical protein TBR22_A05930 [Luteitalea sp. TBR-22]|uniref:hypothetical protein n=1 Tax=Luteitalea sp. TBR-22 TaxID=2802971 RepID=UPI001AF9A448|nr:hypothetical protein [Luteitalea sp. TBR-22]BCS31392.1 hypothetical protein TBR22_A05930 [Luteitalea sp. TBR-22]
MALTHPSRGREQSDAVLQLVGYWHAAEGDGLPHPQQLVHPRWQWRRRRRILRYLGSGVTALQYRGFSYCRFGCGGLKGTRDFTDGTWVWPEGLSHYVRWHGVSLPEAFVAHMAAHDFTVPIDDLSRHHSMPVSDDLWREWAHRQGPYRAIACCYACREERGATDVTLPVCCHVPFRWASGWLWYHLGFRGFRGDDSGPS